MTVVAPKPMLGDKGAVDRQKRCVGELGLAWSEGVHPIGEDQCLVNLDALEFKGPQVGGAIQGEGLEVLPQVLGVPILDAEGLQRFGYIPEGFSEGFPVDSFVNFLPDHPVEEYEGPPDRPSTGGSSNTDASSEATSEPSASVSWNDVPCGRPVVVIPTPGPCPIEAFAAKKALEKLRSSSVEMSVLVDEALLELLFLSRPRPRPSAWCKRA